MTLEIALVLIIVVVAIFFFAWERFGPDVVAIGMMITLALTGLISIQDAFSGFASPAVVTVWAVYIISDGLFVTGVADYLGAQLNRLAGGSEVRLIAGVMLLAGLMSAFMNNVGATAILLPAIVQVGQRTGVPPSKLLIPLSFASLMGGNLTLIGTPPNILAADIITTYNNIEPFRFFDFTPMGLIILGSGTLYMLLIGRHLLPSTRVEPNLTETYHLRDYTTELFVPEGSSLVGKTLSESRLTSNYDLTVVRKLSADDLAVVGPHPPPTNWTLSPHDVIEANDVFLVTGKLEKILQVRETRTLKIRADITLSDDWFRGKASSIAEAIIPPTSMLIDQTLEDVEFRDRYKLNVLAIWRDEHPILQKLANMPLQLGDVLLVQGRREHINQARSDPGLIVIGNVPYESRRKHLAPVTLSIIAVMLVVVTAGLVHISLAAVMAALAMVLLGVLTMDEAYRAIQWRSVFLIAGMLPLGVAMEQTGTAAFLAEQIVFLAGGLGALGVLIGIYLLTLFITQPMSNAAATVLFVPIAIDAAVSIGADPRAFVMAVVIAASTAFLTPIGHQSNVLVYGVGGYRFLDFTKVGLGLNVMYLIIVALVLPLIWPLY